MLSINTSRRKASCIGHFLCRKSMLLGKGKRKDRNDGKTRKKT